MYVRIRNRVRGPYGEDVLKQMSQNGQLARSHEISSDGIQWKPASDFPELFLNREHLPNPTVEPVSPEQPLPPEPMPGPPPLTRRTGMPPLDPEKQSEQPATADLSETLSRKRPLQLGSNESHPAADSPPAPNPGKKRAADSVRQPTSRSSTRKRVTPARQLVHIILGGLFALPTAQLVLWQLDRDPLHLAPVFRRIGCPEFILPKGNDNY